MRSLQTRYRPRLGAPVLAAALAAFSPLRASGQDASAPANPPLLPLVLVTSPTTVPTPVSDIGSSITVITAAQLAAGQLRTVPDALAAVPGLNVVQEGGPGGQTSVFMRGTDAGQVKVLIDGIDVADPASPNDSFDFGQLLTSDIARIEVLRGPQSGLYGSDAIGGVIDIITRKGHGPLAVSATAEGGSFGTFNQMLSLGGSKSVFDYRFDVSHYRATGTPVTPLDALLPGEKRNDDFYDNLTFSTRLGATIDRHLSVDYIGRYTRSSYWFTGDSLNDATFVYFPSPTQSLQSDRQAFSRAELASSFFAGRLKSYAGVNYSSSRTLDASPDSLAQYDAGKRIELDWRNVIVARPGVTFVLGASRKRDYLRQNNPETDASQADTGAYAELQSSAWRRVFVVANVRYDDFDTFGGHVTWRLAPALILPRIGTRLKASYGTGFKAPTLGDLYVSYPAFFFFANPLLKPEQSRGYDVGFVQPALGGALRFGATYYRNDIRDLIEATFTSYVNTGRAVTHGIESFAEWRPDPALRVRADYTLTHAVDAITRAPLQRRPEHKGSLTVTWQPLDSLTLSGSWIAVSHWIDDYNRNNPNTAPGDEAPGYAVVNVAGSYRLGPRLTVFARIDNLLDRRYQEPLGFLQPGFGVYAGVRVAAPR